MPSHGSMRIRDIELIAFGGVQPPASSERVIYLHKGPDFLSRLDRVVVAVAPVRMVEIGIFHGGSAIYWHHRLGLERLTLLDIAPGAPQLEKYLQRHSLEGTVRAHFGVSQDDSETVRRLVSEDTAGAAIDVIIDDASHMYSPTLASLECLFPMVRPGGAYVIEDWAWGHCQGWPVDSWSEHPLVSPLIAEAILVCGRMTGIIDRVEIDRDYAVLWRGNTALPQDGSFRLKDHYFARDFALP